MYRIEDYVQPATIAQSRASELRYWTPVQLVGFLECPRWAEAEL
jgi:hypothetical protein